MQTELYQGEEITEQFSPSRTSVLLLDYIGSFAIIGVSIIAAAGIVTFLDTIPIVGDYIGSSVIIALGLIVAVPGIIGAEIKVRANTYYLTNQRIIHEYKFLKYSSKIIKFDRITNLTTNRGLIDRLFRTGKIKIKTAGTDEAEMTIKKIKNHSNIEKEISKNIQNSRNNNSRQNNSGQNSFQNDKGASNNSYSN